MTEPIQIVAMTTLALVAGGGAGFWFGRRGADRALTQQRLRSEQELQTQQSRAAEATRALQAKAARDLQDSRAAWQAGQAEATAAQRAELEKLTRHLADAYDELDRLRVVAARASGPADTSQGFPATMPLGDL